MIKCNRSDVEITGNLIDIGAEYANLTHCMREALGKALGEKTDEYISKCFKDGMMDVEELKKEDDRIKGEIGEKTDRTIEMIAKALALAAEKIEKKDKEEKANG